MFLGVFINNALCANNEQVGQEHFKNPDNVVFNFAKPHTAEPLITDMAATIIENVCDHQGLTGHTGDNVQDFKVTEQIPSKRSCNNSSTARAIGDGRHRALRGTRFLSRRPLFLLVGGAPSQMLPDQAMAADPLQYVAETMCEDVGKMAKHIFSDMVTDMKPLCTENHRLWNAKCAGTRSSYCL